ncbi:MAG: hypothetical protein K2G33_03040 [Duncaniella sp.]|nr:hypothetical protein [Duncaniella sp.]
MKGIIKLLMVLAALCPLGLWAQGTADIASRLKEMECFVSKAEFSVTLPQNDMDVVYGLELESSAVKSDSYSPCDYLITWTLDTPNGEVQGFSAYYDGNHYRYRDNRLQEYHVSWDSIPFRPTATGVGVQAAAQFADLLPQYIGLELEKMSADPRYKLTVNPSRQYNGVSAISVKAVMAVNDVTVQEKEFIFDSATLRPIRIDTESNPGSITEQTVLVDYTYTDGQDCAPIDEQRLMTMYPDVFEKYRESNFRIENLASTPLPTFSLPTTTGERYTYHKGDGFATPTVIALLDPSTSFNGELVKAVRGAVDSLPYNADVIWVFNSTNVDAIEAIVPEIREGEHLLMNGKALVRDCGASSLPVIIMAAKDGIVKKVNLGFNNEVENIVLQTMALIN